ncbi:MAG TPA: hypothetical protein DEF51_54580, partial [Myxococcales bacterium]|nr:hypothetical protein [Myxococcales bacterium]
AAALGVGALGPALVDARLGPASVAFAFACAAIAAWVVRREETRRSRRPPSVGVTRSLEARRPDGRVAARVRVKPGSRGGVGLAGTEAGTEAEAEAE